ncbi:MAG: hypothetical protein CMP65_03925 [Flavobacteriales bacterium]|nr:hypothetical protein [Flavobacteriales bacterium]
MKINRFVFIFFIFLSFSCDKISPPFTVDEELLDPYCGNSENIIKKILIEEFTGHRCSACPNAARIIENEKNIYCDHIIVLAYHPEGTLFTNPGAPPFTEDFRTPEGTEIGNTFGALNLPKILLNRKEKEPNLWVFKPEDLATSNYVNNLLFDQNNNPIEPKLDINIDFEETLNSSLNITIELEKLNEVNGNFKLVVVISEDEIISGQEDGKEEIPDYEHNHIFRTSLNGTWGELIDLNQVNIIKNFSFPYLNSNIYDLYKCSIIAYVYNEDTNEIIQAEQKYIEQ